MAQQPTDDVIRIRIDTTEAVDAFHRLLQQQAAEGETSAPANPAATAIWRELAPFRLVEYAYIDSSIAPIDGAYIGFPKGTIYAVEEDIPDQVVNDLLSGREGQTSALPPLYVYLPLQHAYEITAIETFLTVLSAHIGRSITAILPGRDGEMVGRIFESEQTGVVAVEGGPYPSGQDVLDRFAARSRRPDGRAYAALTLSFARHVLEFPDVSARDAFIVWTRTLCDWIFAQGGDADALGFAGAYRPGEIAAAPAETDTVVSLTTPVPPLQASPEAMRTAWHTIRDAIEAASPPRPGV